jgi:hypothetical protein
MLIFKVYSIDEAILPLVGNDPLKAEIHSIFPKCLNLVEQRGKLLSLISKNLFNGPGYILIEPEESKTFLALKVGDIISLNLNLNYADFWQGELTYWFPKILDPP